MQKRQKAKGGMIGFTRNKGAVACWILSQHERSAISKHCEEMTGKDDRSTEKRGLNVANMEKYEEDISRGHDQGLIYEKLRIKTFAWSRSMTYDIQSRYCDMDYDLSVIVVVVD
ncbi:Hypothetical predicted protein [Octopus vulgaris]|uniref:Uncharacterized protein n=1 Tax=Octopus vulgaris TaxID=6645 RepID=A0AA36BFX9_OCTVU|nr:Hypothetical predicted protein [Octopus vulgaris]